MEEIGKIENTELATLERPALERPTPERPALERYPVERHVIDRRTGHDPAMIERLIPEMSFLAENPEAFGLISDACPLATKHLLIGANGRGSEGGEVSPVYELDHPGADGLWELYEGILPRTAEIEDALHFVFGPGRTLREHPVSRYCAVLAEMTALQVMNGPANGASYEQTLVMLNSELRRSMHALRERFAELDRVEVIRDAFFEPSIGICRIHEAGDGNFVADIFSAGDFCLYILDERGMAPLWSSETAVFSLEGEGGFEGTSLRFHHPSPFAVLLVSESICALNAAEHRSMLLEPGLVWRYRMRVEQYFLRLLTDCVRELEFGDRATRFFVGRSHGRDSASGAMSILRDGVSYETFRLHCQTRLSALDRQMELLPKGYDPTSLTALKPRSAVEVAYLRRLLEQSPELTDRVANALRLCILDKLERGEDDVPSAVPEEIPDYVRLNREEIRQAFYSLDCENEPDRERIRENNRVLRESFSEHWITLRPILIPPSDSAAAGIRSYREVCEAIYRSCLEMNRRLAEMQDRRRTMVREIKNAMIESLEMADAEEADWICGRAGAESVGNWLSSLQTDLPPLLSTVERNWRADTERYRSLLTAYTAERDDLFDRDVRPGNGAFSVEWKAILEGTLPEETWKQWRARLNERPETAVFAEFFDAISRVSQGTGALMTRIRARAAENRMAREMSNRMDLRIAALRGAAYEDPDWGNEIISVMDNATRNEFRATVRRWQETRRLLEHQKQAFEAYSAMYGTYEVKRPK